MPARGLKLYLFILLIMALSLPAELLAAQEAPKEDKESAEATDDATYISVYDWYSKPFTPLADKPMAFDLKGALGIKARFHHNLVPGLPEGVNKNASDYLGFLRLMPSFHMAGPFVIKSRFDIIGTISYGARPNDHTLGWYNHDNSKILVQSLWMELGIFQQRAVISIGRIPRHLGLGIWQNSGSGPEASHGAGLDQIQLIFKLGSILLIPSLDFISSGPERRYFASRPIDADNLDDAIGINFLIAILDSHEDLAELLQRGASIWNFSLDVFYRQQARLWHIAATGDEELSRTDGRMVGSDFWLSFYRRFFRLEFEGLFYWHRFKTLERQEVTGVPFGLAMEIAWWPEKARRHLGLSFKSGIASGDRTMGFAKSDNYLSQMTSDKRIDSFVFHPDYHIDEILFKRVIGSVSGAFYLRPQISWLFPKNLLAELAFIYSGAIYKESAPGGASPLGAEFNLRLSWHSRGMQGISGLAEHELLRHRERAAKRLKASKNSLWGGLEISLIYAALVPLSGLEGYLDGSAHLLEMRFLMAF